MTAAAAKMLPRAEPIARKTAWRWGLDWEELYQEALMVMWKEFIKKKDAPLIFWEERFYRAFKSKCITVATRMQRRDERHGELLEGIERADVAEGGGIESAVRTLDPHAIVVVLRALTAKQRQAVYLSWHEDLPVSGGDGSVSHTMGISPSMVHRHLREAKARIAELRETDAELRSLLGLGE